MRVRIVSTGRRIEPFNDPMADVLIANRALSEWQDEMLAGFERVDNPPCLVVPDTLFTTGVMLRRFIEQAKGRNAVAVLARSLHADSSTPVQPRVTEVEGGYRFEDVRFDSGGEEEPVEIVLDPEEETFPLPIPEVLGGPTEIGLPRHPLLTLHHWVHILWANQAAGAMEVRRVPKWRGALRLLWAAIRAMSFNKWRVLAKLNTVGKNCDIHPTAVVEGSTLGDNVTIGPHARVVFSRLGDGVTIMTGAEVEASTLGHDVTVGQRAALRLCVVYPGSFSSQIIMQACVIGRRVFTTPGSYSLDLNLHKDIRVMLDGELHSTKSRFLGSAFGHDVRVAAGVWLASGRSLPNGVFVIKNPEGIASRIEGTADDGPLVVHQSRMVPLKSLR